MMIEKMSDTQQSRTWLDMGVLLVAIVLFAAAGPLIKWLILNGDGAGVPARSLTFCNVLFAGNLCAGVTTLAIFGPRRVYRELREQTPISLVLLLVNTVLAVLVPALIFLALEETTVTNVVLLGRLECAAFALFAALFFGERFDRRRVIGHGFVVAGVVTLVVVQSMGHLTRGDWFVVAAAIVNALSICGSRLSIRTMSAGTYVSARNGFSALIFFVIAIVFYGPIHFMAVLAPGLWIAMLIYGLLIVSAAQMCWFRSIERVDPATISFTTMLNPFIAIMLAVLLLDEKPGTAQLIGGAVIAIGMSISLSGRSRRMPPTSTGAPDQTLAAG